MNKLRNGIIWVTGCAFSLFHLYVSSFGSLPDHLLRAIHLTLIMVLAFVILKKKDEQSSVSFYCSLLPAALSLVTCGYLIITYDDLVQNIGISTPTGIAFGILLCLLVLEAARRTVGIVLAGSAVLFIVIGLFGPYMPGFLANRGYSVERIAYQMYLTTSGIYGSPLGVSATMIALFVVFGSFLDHFKAGKFFIDLAFAFTGKSRGGPAKAAVVGSALMGTISGSAAANVAVTGTFTIPLMRRAGYDAVTAGAIEAVASTGGQIMPPIMASAAFVMAEITGIPYINICIAAVPSALLFFFSLFVMVHFTTLRRGIKGCADAEIPNFMDTLKMGYHLLLPFAVLIYLLNSMYSPGYSAYWAIMATVFVCMLRKETRVDLNGLFAALRDGGVRMVDVGITCAVAGIITGMINLTGIGVKLSSILIAISDGSLPLLLLFTMATSIILGMGMPTVAAYLLLAVLVGPALTSYGLTQLQAHFFILYFGTISAITPPVALAAFTAAGISGAGPMKVGFKAVIYGIVAYIVPFMFVFNDALLSQGDLQTIIYSTVTALVGCVALSAGLIGQLLHKCGITERLILVGAGIAMITPESQSDLFGFFMTIAVYVWQLRRRKKLDSSPTR